MTRKEAEAIGGPINERGTFTGPGKFQGEMAYVAIAWDCMMDGWADEHDDAVNSFSVAVEAGDRKHFPELGRKRRIRCYVRDDGFVCEC